MKTGLLEDLRAKAVILWKDHGLLREGVTVKARALTAHEAIGNPEGDDFPLLKGRERLMEATFRGERGQAFTDRFGDFSGTLAQVADMAFTNNFRRAVFVATLNASLRALGLCQATVHCRDTGPADCAARLVEHLRQRYGSPRISQVGYQPAFVAALGQAFPLRVLDLDPDNIGQLRHGVRIEGPEDTTDAVKWADLLLVTGSTLTNDTLRRFLIGRPLLVYGTTAAGAAALMGWERFCACSS
jgi:hypothetical protein